ncbi:MAG: hypothetical protein IPN29_17460 [Saprospiraceae bacterium]|nr:hypothetical protein [Saprospiraceae bacterium]
MSLPKFFAFASVLSPQDMRSFRKFLLSRIGVEADPFAIFDYVATHQKWKKEYPGNEAMAAAILPKTGQKVFLNYLSMLYDHAQEWMAMEELKAQPYEQDLMIQRWLNRRSLYHLADQVKDKMVKSLKAEDTLDHTYAKLLSDAHFEQAFCHNPHKFEFKEEEYLEMVESFDEYVTGQYLVLMTELFNFEVTTHTDHPALRDYILSKIEKSRDTEVITLLKAIYRLMQFDEIDALLYIKDVLLAGKIKAGSKLNYIVSIYAIRKSHNLYTRGLHNDKNLIYTLSNYGLNSGVYFNDGRLSPVNFHNLVMCMCLGLDFEDVLHFIEKWMPKVNVTDAAATANLARAQACFYTHRYDEIYKYTLKGDLDFTQKNLAQGLFLIATFMHRFKDPSSYKREYTSSINFIKRHASRMSTHLQASYQNLFRFMKDIDAVEPDAIKLEDYHPLIYKSWCEYTLEMNKGRP